MKLFFSHKSRITSLLLLLCTSFARGAERDSISIKIKEPKHYFQTCLYYNFYGTPERKFTSTSRNGTYQFSQNNLGFYTPLYTRTRFTSDTTVSTFHLLLAGNMANSKVDFSLVDGQRKFSRFSIGAKAIYNPNAKSTWFVNVAPFSSQDQYTPYAQRSRLSTVLIYNRTVSRKFSYRLGYVKTYIFGTNLHLPIIGFRFGPLDGTFVNIQLFRNISVNVPITSKLTVSAFIRPSGGVTGFNSKNTDFTNLGRTVQFRRFEMLSGMQFNVVINRNFSFFAATGFSRKGQISIADNRISQRFNAATFKADLSNTVFLQGGLSVRFGKTKRIENNYTLYDIMDLNNSYGNDDNNAVIENGNIPAKSKGQTAKNLQYKDVQDLITETDLY